MLKAIFSLLLTIIGHSAYAQEQIWNEIADFPPGTGGEYISCVYFLDLPGPPRIGFVGTQSNLWKTTNGGGTWTRVGGGTDSNTAPEYFVSGICFMDTLTGWFTMTGGTDVCYRTSDGGNSWMQLMVPDSNYGAISVYYRSGTNRLFLGMADAGMEVSTDLGNTWNLVTTGLVTTGISFFNDSIGIAAASPINWTNGWSNGIIQTIDGGLTWSVVDTVASGNPLTIPGTPICFEADPGMVYIRRSDDYGKTWRVLKYFGDSSDCTGIIRGDTTRLYIQMNNSMYVSTDQGITWFNDGGPGSDGNAGFLADEFYSGNGVTIAGRIYGDFVLTDGGLWEEDWPQAGVAESGAANTSNALSIFPNPATNSITIESANGPVSILDPLGRSYTTPQPPPPIESRAGPWKGGGVSIDISTLPLGVYFVSDGYSRSKFVKE